MSLIFLVNLHVLSQGSEFCNSSFKKCLEGNDIDVYLSYNEGKSVVAERFIRTLKNKILSIRQLCQKMFILML